MTTPRKARYTLLAAAIVATTATLSPFAAEAVAQAAATDWAKRITETGEGGHQMGNPLAATRVVEYMSYTCPHCAAFERDSDSALKTRVLSGKLSFEVRNLVRDPVDLTAAMIARCGGKNLFFRNHSALLRNQQRWLGKAMATPRDKQQLWYQGSEAERMKRIAADTGLYAEAAALGYDKAATDRCLSSKPDLDKVVAMTVDAGNKLGINSTPSFTVNGSVAKDVHDWKRLEAALPSG